MTIVARHYFVKPIISRRLESSGRACRREQRGLIFRCARQVKAHWAIFDDAADAMPSPVTAALEAALPCLPFAAGPPAPASAASEQRIYVLSDAAQAFRGRYDMPDRRYFFMMPATAGLPFHHPCIRPCRSRRFDYHHLRDTATILTCYRHLTTISM